MWGTFFVVGLILCALIGLARAKGADAQVVKHWAHLFDRLSQSPQEFYDLVETELVERQVPQAKGFRTEMHEGNLMTGKRLYFEVRRGENRVVICGAPFGRAFFVSWWLIIPPNWLLLAPVIGWIIGIFTPATYYRIDTALMFQSAIHDAVQEVLDTITKTTGVRPLTEEERKPIMRDFFKR